MNTSLPQSGADARILVLERLLRASERRYSATVARIREGVIATDAFGRVTFMNPTAETLTKWTNEEAKGVSINELCPLIVEVTGALRDHTGPGALCEQEARLDEPTLLATRDGERIPIDACTTPIIDEADGVVGSVLVFRDTRPQRLGEDILKPAEEQGTRGAQLGVLRLTQGVAHDFNNILAVIIGLTDMLVQEQSLSPHDQRLIDDIKEAGQRGANLVQQLLRLGRTRAPEPATLDLGTQVADITGLLQRLVGDDIVLTTAAAPELWSVHADPSQTEQVLMNLAANARDAMPSGGRLSLGTRNVDVKTQDTVERRGLKPGRYVLLTVTDTGIGMEKAVRERIFEPFFTTKGLGRGTGLGLATVYGIVKQWGGFIFASSETGKGATFELFFPALQAPSMVAPVWNQEAV